MRIDAAAVLVPGGVLRDASVVVEAGAITWVGPTADAPADEHVVDARDGVLAPGLVDAHTHLGLSFARALGPIEGHPVYDLFWPLERALDPELVEAFAAVSAAESLLSGTTTVADHYFFADASVAATSAVGLRSVVGETIIVLDGPWAGTETLDRGVDFVERHRDTPLVHPLLAPHALDTVGDDVMRDIVAESARLDVPIHLHVAQSEREVATVLEASGTGSIERLADLDVFDRRVIAAHCMYAEPAGLDLLTEAPTVTAIYCPTVHAHLGRSLRAGWLRGRGAQVGIGTDAVPMQRRDLMSEVRSASALQAVLEDDPDALPIAEALEMVTQVNATAVGLGETVGSIDVGKRADLVLHRLDSAFTSTWRDAASLVATSSANTVDKVWVDGELVVDDGHLTRVDEAAIAEGAATARAALFDRVPGL